MPDVYHHTDEADSTGSGAALGILLGVLLVLALLVGAWWLFFRTPAVVEQPSTTIIEENQPPVTVPNQDTNTNIQEAPQGGTPATTAP